MQMPREASHTAVVLFSLIPHDSTFELERERAGFSCFYLFVFLFKVKVTIKDAGSAQEEYIRSLERGDFFGEKALQG